MKSINQNIINSHFKQIENKVNKLQISINRYEITNRAIKYFGTTKTPHEASYILYNGKMLDFSDGRENQRILDHDYIYKIYTDEELDYANDNYRYGGIIIFFQDVSNSIRISVSSYDSYIYLSIQNSQLITKSQIKTLKYIKNYDTERHIIYDVHNKEGYSLKSGEVNSIDELIYKLYDYIEKEN